MCALRGRTGAPTHRLGYDAVFEQEDYWTGTALGPFSYTGSRACPPMLEFLAVAFPRKLLRLLARPGQIVRLLPAVIRVVRHVKVLGHDVRKTPTSPQAVVVSGLRRTGC